jgi:hypothetical protein
MWKCLTKVYQVQRVTEVLLEGKGIGEDVSYEGQMTQNRERM